MRSGAIPFGKDRDKDRPLWEEQRLSEHGEEEGLQGRLLDHTGWSPTAGETPKTLCKTEALWFFDRERAQGLPTYAGGHPHPGMQRDCVDGAPLPLSALPRPQGYLGLTVRFTAALVIVIGLVSRLADAGAV